MYIHNERQMIMPEDFYLPFGGKLNPKNRWCQLATIIPWTEVEDRYAKMFKKGDGQRAYSVRVALGALIIQTRKSLSDRELVQEIAEGLKNIFAHTGGVPTRLWFDKLSPAVKKILKNHGRELTDAFIRFKNHHGFTAAFCNAGKGHEKGNVENKVGYHRRNLLVPVPQTDDLKAFNRQLLELCDQDMTMTHYTKKLLIKDLFEGDRKALLPLPAVAFDESELKVVRTNSYAKFTLEGGKHTYSIAQSYANSELSVRLTAHDVIVLDESYREIKRHPRLYGQQEQESMDWLPYLTQLSCRPASPKCPQ